MSESTGFSAAEKAAMAERAEELRAQRGGKKKADALQDLMEKIEAMPEQDRALAVAVHQIVTEVAPELEPRTWYGMPAYARGKDVLVFLQVGSKFDVRYTTLGFNESAALDDGPMWPTAYALTALNDDVRARIADLVRRAVG
ncbi:iron chaperone [Micrococcus endophyticus]|uniref:iron chaperone n=1 Tax=Micrococcus endophyticus TaxID=455343 RepID=UPI0034CDFB45